MRNDLPIAFPAKSGSNRENSKVKGLFEVNLFWRA